MKDGSPVESPAKSWAAVVIEAHSDQEDLASWLLMQCGAQGCEVDPLNGSLVRIKATFDSPHLPDETWEKIKSSLEEYGLGESLKSLKRKDVVEEDWLAKWKEGFEPFRVGTKFLICPSWYLDESLIDTLPPIESELSEGRFKIYIDPGMAFGIQFGFAKIFLTLFSLIAGSALLWYLSKIKRFSLLIQIGITLLIAGALGNFIDRCFYGVLYGEQALFYGYVVDFIQVDIPDIDWFGATYTHWPVFNIADSCVSVGMVLLLIRNKYLPTLADIKNAENPSIISPEQTQFEASQTDTTLSDNVSDNEDTK